MHVEEHPVQYVALASSANPVAPYTSWATAATNIQDAVDVAPPGATIFVTNGVYTPVSVNTPLTVQSVNGPGVTIINGGGAQGCVYLTNNAAMVGFTLTNGVALVGGESIGIEGSGGGVYCESTSAVVSNCVLSGNSAILGGGAYRRHAQQLHADRQLGVERLWRRGVRRHAQQLHADRQLVH